MTRAPRRRQALDVCPRVRIGASTSVSQHELSAICARALPRRRRRRGGGCVGVDRVAGGERQVAWAGGARRPPPECSRRRRTRVRGRRAGSTSGDGCDPRRSPSSRPAFTNPFYARVSVGAAEALGDRYQLVFPVPGSAADRAEAWHRVLAMRLDGAIVAAPSAAVLDQVPATLPIVVLDSPSDVTGRHRVNLDVAAGAVAVAEHLLDLGHRQVAFMAGQPETDTLSLRRRGAGRRARPSRRSARGRSGLRQRGRRRRRVRRPRSH